MKLKRYYYSANAVNRLDIQKTGTYMLRVWGTFGSGTLAITEAESGLTVDSFTAAERVEVTLERGQQIVATLTGSTTPKLYFELALIQWYDDTDRRADANGM